MKNILISVVFTVVATGCASTANTHEAVAKQYNGNYEVAVVTYCKGQASRISSHMDTCTAVKMK